jgi:hypothetical protein
MKNQAAKVAVGLSILAGATILGGILAEPVIAQVRAALVKDADNPARQPFAVNSGVSPIPVGANTATQILLTVPAGKRAVIEHVSCIDFLASGDNFVRMELRHTLGGAGKAQQFVHDFVGGSLLSGINIWSFSQPIRAYADPGTEVAMVALRRTVAGTGGIECELSGYYVDMAL